MSILNQSIGPCGQPLFPSKGTDAQDVCQQLPMAMPRHGTRSLKAPQLSSSKSASITIASRDSSVGESFTGATNVTIENERQNGMPEGFGNGICNLSHLLGDEHQSSSMDHHMTIEHNDERRTAVHDVEFQPFTPNFFHSFMYNEKLNVIEDVVGEVGSISSQPIDVLAIVVSSAVKLDSRQIDLIARKMQRLTGFRNLRMENIIDPSLIAGFVISYGDDDSHIIDLSVKGQLAVLAARVESSDQRVANHGQNWSLLKSKG
ncbi:ATP synthase delta chain, chloroplastic [Elaeis guineensis]|uniref:ATP synthase delta chain, chloroplastic n=1 Tax=Elaeis guineensis var. tenera TaxID=51953 RepID=A0A6I9RGT2_ELAGV|nr:ATP synthase delta chain, chloroplastic [Elaeis guineensis]